ncbi:TonB-dependent siderophore receptor [Brevundimonas sp.]|uniref:TonB-dependent receptor plug domain-containing protein n=1 Tax=Brevundimonas sp. TaxID=1871086 RepID=UPI001A1F3A65|nr:TonB-dependent receptor [Brevundimonas sp.]MBJ7484056.1 TonB-dependent receptor [Brevundimonas sp.]
MKTALRLSAATAALLLTATTASAQAALTTDQASALLGDVVVTANRSAQAADRVGQSVTVLTTDRIEASQAVAVVDLLARTPGVSVTSNGGPGQPTALRIRGAEGDQTLVVVDGVKLNDPSAPGAGYNFGNLLTGDVARIEVLRGAQSTLWGSQAIGGVVSLVTARPTEPFQASLDAEAGSRGTHSLRGGLGGATDRIDWRVAASHYQTDGFSAFAGGTEDDAYENTGLSGRVNVAVTDDVSLDLRAVYSSGTVDFDGFPAPAFAFADTNEYGMTKDLVAYAGVNFDLFEDRLKNRVAYGFTRTDRQSFNPAQANTTLTFDSRGENRRYEYQSVLDIRDGWVATFGAEHEDSEFRSASPSSFTPNPVPATASVGLDGFYAQVQAEVIDGLTLTGGVRRDEHDAFGGKTLGQAAAAWALNDGATVLRASFGQGFKAPSLFQLYSNFGNAGLMPEEADGWDTGVEQHLFGGAVIVSATYFDRDTTNQIDFASCTGTETLASNPLCFRNGVRRFGYYANIARATANGVELAAQGTFGALQLDANYTLTDTTNESPGANRGRELARRPQDMANLSATYVWPIGLSTTVAARYAGESFDNASNSARLDAYTLVDLRASYPVNDTVEIYGRIENVGDEVYETTRTYGVAGRGTFVGVRARF